RCRSRLTPERFRRPRSRCSAMCSDALARRLTEAGARAAVWHDFHRNLKEPWSTFRFLTRRGVLAIRRHKPINFRAGMGARGIKNAKTTAMMGLHWRQPGAEFGRPRE